MEYLPKKAPPKAGGGHFDFAASVLLLERIQLDCGSTCTYVGVSPINYGGTYFRAHLQRAGVHIFFYLVAHLNVGFAWF